MALKSDINKREEGVFIVALSGSLDSTTYSDLENKVKKLLVSSTKAVVFDMRGVNYVSSLGLGVVINARKKIEELGGNFIITGLQPQVKRVFDIIKALPNNISVFESMEEADEYFSAIQRKCLEEKQGK